MGLPFGAEEDAVGAAPLRRDGLRASSARAPLHHPRAGRWQRPRDGSALGIAARSGARSSSASAAGLRGSGSDSSGSALRATERQPQSVGGRSESLAKRATARSANCPRACARSRANTDWPSGRSASEIRSGRWGSCSPNGHICLNWRLVLMPDAVRDYVLIHELMHLRRMDHSPRVLEAGGQSVPWLSGASRVSQKPSPRLNTRSLSRPNFGIAARAFDLDGDGTAAAGSGEDRIDDLQEQRLEARDGLRDLRIHAEGCP